MELTIPITIFLLFAIPFFTSNEKISQGHRIGFLAVVALIGGLALVFKLLLG